MIEESKETIDLIKTGLEHSFSDFQLLEEFLIHVDNHISLLESVLESSLVTLSRITLDKWICDINLNQEKNREYFSLAVKLEKLMKNDVNPDQFIVSFSPLSKVYANMRDNKGFDESGRPVLGVMSKPFVQQAHDVVVEFLCDNLQFSSWSEWLLSLERVMKILQLLISYFPGSHSFGTLPLSLVMMINTIKNEVMEQAKLYNVLDILTSSDSRGEVYHLDMLMVKHRILPVPSHSTGEE